MITRRPYHALATVLAVMVVDGFVSSMIGQFNDGPWGALPSWLGATTWFTFLGASLALLVLTAYLIAANQRHRKAAR